MACLKDIVAAASDPTSHPALKTDLGKIQFGVWLPTGMKKEEIKSLVGEALYDELTQVRLFSFSQAFWDNFSTHFLQLFLKICCVWYRWWTTSRMLKRNRSGIGKGTSAACDNSLRCLSHSLTMAKSSVAKRWKP